MSVRRSAEIIAATVPLLLVGAAAPALAQDQAPPAAVETASAQESLTLPLEISGIVDGLSDRETARVEAFAPGLDGRREPLGSVQADSEGRYLLQGAARPGAPVLLEVTVWEPGREDEALSTWYGDSPDLAGAEALRAVGSMDGIDIAMDLEEVEYFHMLFDRHEIVVSDGAETESLYTASEAMKAVGPAAREEIFALFPHLRDHIPGTKRPVSARPLPSSRMARKLTVRHKQHKRDLVM